MVKEDSKFLRANRFNMAGLLKKTAVGSLVGMTVLGTLPGLAGLTQAAPIEVVKPLVEKGGWQPALQNIDILMFDGAGNVTQAEIRRARGLTVQSGTIANDPKDLIAFYDPSGQKVYFGSYSEQYASGAFAESTVDDGNLEIRDLVMGPMINDEMPELFGTGEQLQQNESGVYQLFEQHGNLVSETLVAPGTISDPKGIDFENETDTLYVAGGSDGQVWKLTRQYELNGNSDNDPNSVSVQGMIWPYAAEPVEYADGATQIGTSVTDVVYDQGYLYAADAGSNRVVKLNLAVPNPQLEVVASDLDDPQSIDVDSAHNVYIADTDNYEVKKVDAVTGQVQVIAGTGEYMQLHQGVPAAQTSLNQPRGVAVSPQNDSVFVLDRQYLQIIKDKFFYKQVKDENGVVWNLVENAEGLDHMRDSGNSATNYRLTVDISASELNDYLAQKSAKQNTYNNGWTPIGDDEVPFGGTLDGGGHTIDGLTVKSKDREGELAGLFGGTYKAELRNLRLTNVKLGSTYAAGGLTAQDYASTIEKVSVEGTVFGTKYAGGLIGRLSDTNIEQSSFRGQVQGSTNLGGLIGQADVSEYNRISDNYAWADLSIYPSPFVNTQYVPYRAGGFVGNVSTEQQQFNSGGPIVANTPTFRNNYASSSVASAIIFMKNGDLQATDVVEEGSMGPFEGKNEADIGVSGVSNYWDSTIYGKAGASVFASELTADEMKNELSFKEWDFQNIWTKETKDTKRAGYPVLLAFQTAEPTIPTNPTEPTTPVNPTPSTPSTPSTGGGGSSTPIVSTPAPQSNTTTINVNVQNNKAANGAVVSSLAITRTKSTDGTTKDVLQLTPAKATEIVNLLKTSGSKTAAIVLPDTADEVSQWDLTVPNAASKLLTDEGIELVILNPNVRITVPASSLTGLTDDLYFRLIPVKSSATSAEIQSRALANPAIVSAANGGGIAVIGRPMTIETNLQSRPVTLILPLPAGQTFAAAQQNKLGVYVEHSDGTKQLVRGKVVTQEDGKLGLEITANHFSTFTVVNVEKWGSTLIASPYIVGYANGSFQPAKNITRAELAAIVGRITGVTEGTATFSDVKNGSWAAEVVGPAAASGVMTGYSDGTFKPNAPITRGELAAALAKLLPQSGLDASQAASGFSDLPAGNWAATAAAELQAAGVVTGYADGSFKPERNVTRAEAVAMINRLVGLDGSTALPGAAAWSDVSDAYWASEAIRAASMQR
ncbi:S-layer homology domain-containing protein [Saccharibacillus sacchari]|uniref:S-layer homology domain-containing protein n=1 Tax=Saccharibacillus sacchari TaxID=456493 RepID=A0ACC6P9G1_9BACL